jgi:hypothetical protein
MNMQEYKNLDQAHRQIIRNQAQEMINRMFDIIPTCLFTNRLTDNPDLYVEESEILEHVGGAECCPHCDSTDLTYNPNHNDKYYCKDCEWEGNHTNIKRSRDNWPVAHGYMFWTTEFQSKIVDCAVESGFDVFESPDLNGFILGIDGGGYDFIEAHWIPLYLSLGLQWHEHEPEWHEFTLEELSDHKKHGKIHVGPTHVQEYATMLSKLLETPVRCGTEHIYTMNLSSVELKNRLINLDMTIHNLASGVK